MSFICGLKTENVSSLSENKTDINRNFFAYSSTDTVGYHLVDFTHELSQYVPIYVGNNHTFTVFIT